MSEDILPIESTINRRERRICIELDEKYLVRSNFGNVHKFGRSSLAKANEVHSFEAGDEVAGVVHLGIIGGRPVVKVTLALICLTQARAITERRRSLIESIFSQNAARSDEIYFEREKYIEIDLSNGNKGAKFTEGKYEIPFRFYIPYEGLPSTMSSSYGFIKHTIQVFTVDEEGCENRGEKEIIVVAPETKVDLNTGEAAERYLHITNSGTIKLKASLERRGYVAGETIPVKIIIENNTDLDLCPRVKLYQTQVFIYNQLHRAIETCLDEQGTTGEIVSAGQHLSQIVIIHLPANLVVSLRSRLILVNYCLRASVDIPAVHELFVPLSFVVTTQQCIDKHKRRSVKNRSNASSAVVSPSHVIVA